MTEPDPDQPIQPDKTESAEMNDEPDADVDLPVEGDPTEIVPLSIDPDKDSINLATPPPSNMG